MKQFVKFHSNYQHPSSSSCKSGVLSVRIPLSNCTTKYHLTNKNRRHIENKININRYLIRNHYFSNNGNESFVMIKPGVGAAQHWRTSFIHIIQSALESTNIKIKCLIIRYKGDLSQQVSFFSWEFFFFLVHSKLILNLEV